MSLETLKSGQVKYIYKNNSREFISLLAYICVDKIALSLLLIYKGDSDLL